MVFTDLDGRVDEFGGFSGNLYEDTMWRWSGSDWRQVHVAMLPYARSSAAVGVDSRGKQIVLYGGLADVNPLNTWTYDGTTWTIESPANQPLTVYAASAVFDPNLDAVIVFGGGNGGVDQNTTWSWTGTNWEQLITAQSPGPREGARCRAWSHHPLRRPKSRSAKRRYLGTLAVAGDRSGPAQRQLSRPNLEQLRR
jgi:hypothetical protein